jgi:hypothetical protein
LSFDVSIDNDGPEAARSALISLGLLEPCRPAPV